MSNRLTKGQADIGRLNLSAPSSYSSQNLAATGSTITDAALITKELVYATAANGTKGIKLPMAFIGESITVINTVTNQILPVYPPTAAGVINVIAAGSPFNVAAGATATFGYSSASGKWFTSTAVTVAGLTATGADLNQLAGLQTILVKKIALAAVDTAGGLFAWQAPARAFVTAVKVDVTTPATGACTADIGYTTASAATLSDTIIDGADVHTAADVFDNVADAGTNGILGGTTNTGDQQLVAASGKWVTGSTASGASAGIVGNAYIFYVLA